MANADNIMDSFICLYFNHRLVTCSLCTPEGEKGSDVVSKDG